jgi:uncharacterized protein YhaN
MKTVGLIIVIIVVGWLGWRWYSPQPKKQSVSLPRPAPLVHQSPVRRLAPEGTYFLLERAALTTGSGVVGFAPSTKVNLAARKDSISTVTVGQDKFDVASSQLTNDLDIAAIVAQSDFAAQTKIAELQTKWIKEHNQQQRDAIAALEKESAELQRRHRSARRAPNPLERGAYNATQDTNTRIRTGEPIGKM